MITNFFIPELNNHDVKDLWFQQEGVTFHAARATVDLLKDTYVNSLVYADKPQTLDHLEDNIRHVIADIRPQMLEKVIENWTSRLDYIRASRGSHMPEIIFKISELIAIDEALRIIKKMTTPDEIWILCDSRSAIQHLSDWTNVGDKTSVSILKNLKELSQQHEIYFQWIPSHIGLFGNDTADLLAKEELWKTPPTHPWYNRQAPGGALSIKADRVVQTTISRLASGHIRGLSFNLGQKIYQNCTKCNLVQATPDHLLFCAGLEREDIYSSPLLVYDFLTTLGLMDLV
ncbi:RNase H domain-containing protein [Trichonephila clavipes]|uniref:RNase H domain-containing protein n=1 Tax=Trichonephila clavipes TaxID=2585209 RepID=A0A8X6S683_TRICX|nr:RNase H domain-containing protein [Trichonephila clavipes]